MQRPACPIREGTDRGDDHSRTSAATAVVTVLTTEHFTLQGARAATTSESTARAALFVGAVSSGLIAIGFVGQASKFGSSFAAFSLVVLPTLFALGVFTFVRLVQSSTEAINRLRGYYQQLVGEDARYLLLGGHDDIYGVLWNMGMRRPSRWQLWFTLAAMVAVLDAIIAGTTLALVVGPLAKGGLVGAIAAGATTALCSLYTLARVQSRMHVRARGAEPALFPSPTLPAIEMAIPPDPSDAQP